jgi:hypothetical protein
MRLTVRSLSWSFDDDLNMQRGRLSNVAIPVKWKGLSPGLKKRFQKKIKFFLLKILFFQKVIISLLSKLVKKTFFNILKFLWWHDITFTRKGKTAWKASANLEDKLWKRRI